MVSQKFNSVGFSNIRELFPSSSVTLHRFVFKGVSPSFNSSNNFWYLHRLTSTAVSSFILYICMSRVYSVCLAMIKQNCIVVVAHYFKMVNLLLLLLVCCCVCAHPARGRVFRSRNIFIPGQRSDQASGEAAALSGNRLLLPIILNKKQMLLSASPCILVHSEKKSAALLQRQ